MRNIILLTLIFLSCNSQVDSNNKVFKPYNCSCDIEINVVADSIFTIKNDGKIVSKGKFKKTFEGSYYYYYFNGLAGVYNSDTLDIQNYGNAMNPYIHFQNCDEKYIHFANVLSSFSEP